MFGRKLHTCSWHDYTGTGACPQCAEYNRDIDNGEKALLIEENRQMAEEIKMLKLTIEHLKQDKKLAW